MHRKILRAAAVLAGLTMMAADATAAPAAFDRRAWLDDYAALKQGLQQSYANLAWFASPQGGRDLPRLDRRTRRLLLSAGDDEEAAAAILAFVASFHDGHLEALPRFEAGAPGVIVAPPRPEWDQLGAADGCAALGYAPVRPVAYSVPFDALAGSAQESDGLSRVFRAGTVGLPSGGRLGIVRIPRFRPQDAPPAGCIGEWEAWRASGKPLDTDALRDRIQDAWLRTLAAQLKRFQAEGVKAVLVDVGGNSGGNDSGDWSARLFTPREVHAPRMLLSADPSALPYFKEELDGLHQALRDHPQLGPGARQILERAAADFERRKAGLPARHCDLSWVWRERRPWNPQGCSRLIDGGHASGALDYLAPGAVDDAAAAASAFWGARVDALRGAWSGPVYVFVDGKTASSAELFSAELRDNGAARIVGTRSEGDGCGFIDSDAVVQLPHSGLRFHVPNCVRLRADGSDEVAGIAPDLPVPPLPGEDPRSRAARVLGAIDADLGRGAAP